MNTYLLFTISFLKSISSTMIKPILEYIFFVVFFFLIIMLSAIYEHNNHQKPTLQIEQKEIFLSIPFKISCMKLKRHGMYVPTYKPTWIKIKTIIFYTKTIYGAKTAKRKCIACYPLFGLQKYCWKMFIM